ncbi:hypothetical protein D9756_007452 [Leucocoprinus leucothites]|uniref:GIY-YIG domain-containing protein n=1 Tax=Leucocoprinus leucothites TaxID=201217 RepID=A0A8H5D1M2_9AGAR|nr:hypothetical protein D9756_007452 [Leucoagaricus leucothites]
MTNAASFSFPSFYACYLLKSARTPRSYKNYIGSTPDPVRRLRQHNGTLVGGARETALHRPWIMQLLVHGFPSRPAATSFEFAWQNPHKSRFFCDRAERRLFSKSGTKLVDNILVLQQLIRTHPFSTWPLQVKIFTEEAVQCWNELAYTSPLVTAYRDHFQCHNSDGNNRALGNEGTKEKGLQNPPFFGPLFPPGFTCSVELEGVDGENGVHGSGREGPVSITDALSASFASSADLLPPSSSVSHLSSVVLSSPVNQTPAANSSRSTNRKSKRNLVKSDFKIINSGPHSYVSSAIPLDNPFNLGKGLLPRGGTCTSCGKYTLWGDIIKGCFRRHTGRVVLDSPESDADEAVEEEAKGLKEQKELEGLSDVDLFEEASAGGGTSDSDSGSSFKRSRSPLGTNKLTREMEPLSLKENASVASRRAVKNKTKKVEAGSRAKGTAKGKGKKKADARASLSSASASTTSGRAAKIEKKRKTTKTTKRPFGPSTTSASSSEDPTASPSGTVTRSRGRPKKQKDGLTGGTKPELEGSNVGKEVQADQPSPTVVDAPKRRGRPRKITGVTSATISSSLTSTSTSTSCSRT